MGRPPSFFTNLCIRRTPNTHFQNPNSQIRNRNNSNTSKSSAGNGEFVQNSDANVVKIHDFKPQGFTEIAKAVSKIIRSRPRWEETILSEFPTVNFVDPSFYNEVLKHQNNVFLSLRFYYWISSQHGFLPDSVLCTVIFNGLVEAKAAKIAQNFLGFMRFMPEPNDLERYAECLCENGLIEDALEVFDYLKWVNYCPTLKTWNSALSGALQARRADIVWKVYGNMIESGVSADVDTTGYLIDAFCMDDNVWKGYELLRQVVNGGHFPSSVVSNQLIRVFSKSGNYSRMSDVLHIMIAMNQPPGIFTYQEVINGLCKRNMKHEGFRVFNDLKDRGYAPDRVMYTTMIHGLCKMKWLGDARRLWFEMIQKGMIPNEYTYNALIYGYFKIGNLAEAERLSKEMCEIGYGETTVSYNTMIKGLCLNGKVEAAHDLFQQMAERNVACDVITFNSLIQGFCQEGNIAMGTKLLHDLINRGLQPSTASYTVLIEKLCEMGHVEEGTVLWKDMQERGVLPAVCSHDSIIVGLVEQGFLAEGMEWLSNMLESRRRPRQETFERLIHCLSEADKWGDALFVLGSMLKMGYTLNECICLSVVGKLCNDNPSGVEKCIEDVLRTANAS
ncbi:pentatricopeptide repeat-containing protein At5g18950 [Coffea eugenioides]|uniref:pentatricopeptide repeat-containing protein At5g18950 n=1 Tax=Coffea eugenioides TaxID=49369 RepID=UPI000F611A66|nr:pentatricopeptide repeat-containing protein At5g18950 [Coffea eugenioides]